MTGVVKKRANNTQLNETTSKKAFLELTSEKSKLNFLSLDDDCLLEIFNHLSLGDLCVISCVCKRLKNLAEHQFQRKHGSKWMYLKYKSEKVQYTPVKENYVQCFEKYIKNIAVAVNGKSQQKVFDVLDSSQLVYKQILLKAVEFSERINEKTKRVLDKATNIGFSHCTIDDGFYENVLQHCNNMRALAFRENFDCVREANKITWGCHKWMLKKYPNLECVIFQSAFCSAKPVFENLPEFLHKNPSIKALTWYLTFADQTEPLLKTIIGFAVSLEELFVSILYPWHLKIICRELKTISKEAVNLNRIELDFPDKYQCGFCDPDIVSCFKHSILKSKLTGLHCYTITNVVASLVNLKTLHFGRSLVLDLHTIAPHLTHLEDLILSSSRDDWRLVRRWDVKAYITPFIRFSPKLKTIIVNLRADYITDWENHIPKMNEFRGSSENATKVTIFFNKSSFDKFKKSISLLHECNTSTHGWVKIEAAALVQFDLNVQNPFIGFHYERL